MLAILYDILHESRTSANGPPDKLKTQTFHPIADKDLINGIATLVGPVDFNDGIITHNAFIMNYLHPV